MVISRRLRLLFGTCAITLASRHRFEEDGRFGSTNGDGIERWERRQQRYYPGRAHGGEAIACPPGHWRRGEPRGAFVERVLRIAFAGRDVPALGLEIGPCNNPTPVPGDVVSRVDSVDVPEYYDAKHCEVSAGPNANETVKYRPTYLDDAQSLATVPTAKYDVVIACHVLEHVPRPLVAVASWLRVLRPRGVLLLVLPDPCERTLMDRYRLAAPASHHVRDYWARAPSVVPPPEHTMEMGISTLRLLEILHVLKEPPSLARSAALDEVRGRLALPPTTTWDELKRMRLHLIGHKDREGHVHAWSRDALRDTLRAAERLLEATALVAETAASPAPPGGANRRFQEYRVALAKGRRGPDADSFAEQWCRRANDSYVRALRRASPILIGDIDVDDADAPALRGASTPLVCVHLVQTVRVWEACAPAANKADRHDCIRRAAEHAAYVASRADRLRGGDRAA